MVSGGRRVGGPGLGSDRAEGISEGDAEAGGWTLVPGAHGS